VAAKGIVYTTDTLSKYPLPCFPSSLPGVALHVCVCVRVESRCIEWTVHNK